MDPTVTASRLTDLPLFANCDRQERRMLDRLGTRLRRPVGSVLAFEGRPARQVIIILEGVATARYLDGEVQLVAGEIIGAAEVIGRRPHAATIVADTSVVVEALSIREFQTLLATVAPLATELAFAFGPGANAGLSGWESGRSGRSRCSPHEEVEGPTAAAVRPRHDHT
jgi:CRP-like cAMP-binding protein